MKTFDFRQVTISHNIKDPHSKTLEPDCLFPFARDYETVSLWAGDCSPAYGGITFQNNSACLPRPRSGPGPVGRAGFNAPLDFLTGFTVGYFLISLLPDLLYFATSSPDSIPA